MKVVIIGNGLAGVTCALNVRKRQPTAEVTVIGKETDYFYSRTGLMYAFMNRLSRQDLEPFEREVYSKQRINLVRDQVVGIEPQARRVELRAQGYLSYDKLVLATGAIPAIYPWPGLEAEHQSNTGQSHRESGVVHFVSMQDLDACEALTPTTKQAVVVGGGLIGIELAESLSFHGINVTFLVREQTFWPVALAAEESKIVFEEMRRHGIDVRLGEEISKVTKDSHGRVSNILTNRGSILSCQMLGICVGVKPDLRLLENKSHLPAVQRGILVDRSFRTSVPDIFACGDCAEVILHDPHLSADFVNPKRTLAELIWYSAKRQGEHAAKSLCGDALPYAPPLFFNSSKFFDIEYTTVGDAQACAKENPALFLDRSGPKRAASLRIVYSSENEERVLAFNVLGGRADHEVLSRWIEERKTLKYCIAHLKEAQFDVEFGRVKFEDFKRTTIPPFGTVQKGMTIQTPEATK